MAQDETYQTKVYAEREGGAYVLGSGGALRVESGGAMIPTAAIIGLPSVSDTGGVLSAVNLPFSQGVVIISAESNLVSGSLWLTSCSLGADILLILRGDPTGTFTNASTQIDVSCSGCILLGSVGAAISGFEMHTSLASDCWVHLKAVADGVWAIVGQAGDIDE